MVWWADVTDPRTGGWLSWGEARRKFGARLNGVADKRDYEGMLADAGTAANAQHVQRWRAHVAVHGLPQGGLGNGGRGVRVGEEQWEHTAVLGARRATRSAALPGARGPRGGGAEPRGGAGGGDAGRRGARRYPRVPR